MKYYLALLGMLLGAPALAQPTCPVGTPTGAIQCLPQAVAPVATDVVSGVQQTGPTRSNQTVKVSISQIIANGLAGSFSTLGASGAASLLGGGTFTGTFAGSPTLSGAPTFSGIPVLGAGATLQGALTSSGGSVSGSFAGDPTWTGTHTFNGPVTGSGAFSVPVSLSTVIATNGSTARALGDRMAQQINVLDYGAKGDLVSLSTGVYAAGNAAFSSSNAHFTSDDIGKPIDIPGAGSGGATLTTTIAAVSDATHATLTAAPSASSTDSFIAAARIATAQSGGGSYAPGDTITLAGGTATTAAVLTVVRTKVASFAINAAGAGGTNGTCVLIGTTGSPRPFRINATIAGGVVSALGTVIDTGDYTTNPTSLAAEPVTGSGCGALAGATLTLKMGVSIPSITTAGIYSAVPSNPIAQDTTSGSGTGATFTAVSVVAGGPYTYGTDNTAAISSAVAYANTLFTTRGAHSCVYFPSRDSRYSFGTGYFIKSQPTQFAALVPGCVTGDGMLKSIVRMSAAFSGNLFSWSQAWFNLPLASTSPVSSISIGPVISGITVVGDTASPAQQNAFVFTDQNDKITMRDSSCHFVHGYCIATGILNLQANSAIRESKFYNIEVQSSGMVDLPAVRWGTAGTTSVDSTNTVDIFGMRVKGCVGKCVSFVDTAGNTTLSTRAFNVYGLEMEQSTSGDDIMTIGDPVSTGVFHLLNFYGIVADQGQIDHALIRISAPNVTYQPYDLQFFGQITSGVSVGMAIDFGRLIRSHMLYATGGYNYTVGPSPNVAAGIELDVITATPWTGSIDPTSVANVIVPVVTHGDPNALGSGAVNLQTGQSTTRNTASGAQAIAIGDGTNRSDGVQSISIGTGNVSIGLDTSIGTSNTHAGLRSILMGNGAIGGPANSHFAWQAQANVANGDNALSQFLLLAHTTDATPTVMTSTGLGTATANTVANVRDNATYMGAIRCIARSTAGDLSAWYSANSIMTRGVGAATTVLKLDGLANVFADAGAATWTMTDAADTTNGGYTLTFTGEVAKTIHVVCGLSPTVEIQ